MKTRQRVKRSANKSKARRKPAETNTPRIEQNEAPSYHAPLQRMQQMVGNAALCRMLNVQRADVGVPEKKTLQSPLFAGDAKLEAILNGQGRLNVGDKGESVQKVQQGLLNDSFEMKHGADGKYGNETSETVKQFKAKHALGFTQFGDVGPGTMGKLDELNKGGGPGPNPNPNPNPTPIDPPSFNPALEDMMNNIWLQHQAMFQMQNSALTRLEADLNTKEHHESIGEVFLKEFVKESLDAMLKPGFGLLEKAIAKSLKEAKMSEGDQHAVEGSHEIIFEAIKETIKTKSEEAVGNLVASGAPSVDVFIDAQRQALIEASTSGQEGFLIGGKKFLREPATPTPERALIDPDPRVGRANEYVRAVKDKRLEAFDAQYMESATNYGAAQAKSALNGPGRDPELGTDLSKEALGKAKNLKGVLKLKLKIETPDKPAKIEKATVEGLSKKTLDRLSKSDSSLGTLGLPMLGEGSTGGFIGIGSTDVKIGENEKGEAFESGSNNDGKEWLKSKVKNQNKPLPPDESLTVDEKNGAELTFKDIDQVSARNVPGGLQEG